MAGARTTVVVNMFGGPGAGKTTCAWEVAERLKKLGYVTEYVGEYAKELTWDKDSPAATPVERARAAELLDGRPDHQLQIFREQAKRVNRLVGQCDFVVTDSPTLLGLLYMRDSEDPAIHRVYEKVAQHMREDFRGHENFNMVVTRGRGPYEQAGRNQTFAEAREKDRELTRLLEREGVRRYAYSHEAVGQAVKNMQVTLRKARGRAWKREQIERLGKGPGEVRDKDPGEERGSGEGRARGAKDRGGDEGGPEGKGPGRGRASGAGKVGEDRAAGEEKGCLEGRAPELAHGAVAPGPTGADGLGHAPDSEPEDAGRSAAPDSPAQRAASEGEGRPTAPDDAERPSVPDGSVRTSAAPSPAAGTGGWELTDPDVGQYVRRAGGRPRSFEVSETWQARDCMWHARGMVDLDEVDAIELDAILRDYYDGGTDEVREAYGDLAEQVIAECWFEAVTLPERMHAVPEGFEARPWVADARDAVAEPSPARAEPETGLEAPGPRRR